MFVFLSNYFNVLTPQVTGYVTDFVQRELKLPGYTTPVKPPAYDGLVQWFISAVENTGGLGRVVALCGITILCLALLRGFFLFLMRQTVIVMSRHIEYDQKNEVFSHYQRLDTEFYKTHSTGDLMNRIAEDVSRVRMFTGPAVMYLANLLAVISLSVFFMWKRSPELTVYVLIPLPILAVTIYIINKIIHQKSEKIQESLSGLTAAAQESYSGIRVIKSFVQEKALLGFFSQKAEEYKQNATGLARVEAIYFPSITLLIGISTLLTIMVGGLDHINNPDRTSLSTIVEFVMYVNMLTFPVSAIGLTASMIQRAAASQKRLNEFLEIVPDIRQPEKPVQKDIKGNIVFQNVGFTYPHSGVKALRNFSLQIKAGEKVAIIGRTGSGKSTVAQLILRMYDVQEGELLLEECDIKKFDIQALRKSIGYVPQDVFLFSDTVENNIDFQGSAPSFEAIKNAATKAVIHSEVERFSDGYKTVVGERGVTLSGGQKQRISVARALIKQSNLVIFDDCLSAVDYKTESEISANLASILDGKTAIFITHRILSLLDFDRIVVLEDGLIIEEGKHNELLLKNGYYARLYQKQQSQPSDNL